MKINFVSMISKANIIASLLGLIVSLFTLKSAILMTYYALYTDSFIENFCENKDQPELNCDGKCFLSKMLNKEKQQDNRQKSIALSLYQLEYIIPIKSFQNQVYSVYPHKHFFYYNSSYLSVYIKTADKPPSLS